MATFTFTLRGDQIATYTSVSGVGNGVDRVVTVEGVTAIGTNTDIYTVEVTQAQPTDTQFVNGQFVTVYDSLGNVVFGPSIVQPDAEQGFGAGDEHLIFSNGYIFDLTGFDAGITTYQYDISDEVANAAWGDNDGELDFADTNVSFPCFAAGTRLLTPRGEVDVCALVEGDLVETLDHGPQPVAWIARRQVSFVRTPPDRRRPTRIAAGSFGPDLPARDLVLSAQHRVLVGQHGQPGPAAAIGGEFLAPSHRLSARSGVREMRGCRQIELVSVMFERHEIIRAIGLWCESFYPGGYSMATLPPRLRAEVTWRFPMLKLGAAHGYGPMARPSWKPQRCDLAA